MIHYADYKHNPIRATNLYNTRLRFAFPNNAGFAHTVFLVDVYLRFALKDA